jgi:glycosyltransferase involved in cell wall biosynthesis
MLQEMLKHHPNISDIPNKIIPGGANEKIFYPPESKRIKKDIRKKLKLSDDTFYIISSRRLIPRTGVDLLIRAFKKLKSVESPSAEVPHTKLIITGKGESENFLKALAAELNVSNDIIFTGYVSEEELSLYYRASDLYVIPTRFLEGFGLSTVEAMASGLPVIGTEIGGTSEILSEISSDLLIPSPEAGLIAEKIVFMFRQDMAEWGKKSFDLFKKKFRWTKHTELLMDFFHELDDCN